MTGLTHQQAKRYMQAAADKYLNLQGRVALETHLANCAVCRADAAELDRLQTTIARALRARWAAPRRTPNEVSARVRNRVQREAERKIALGFAHRTVKFGSLLVVIALAAGVLQLQTVRSPGTVKSSVSGAVFSLPSHVPQFEFESDTETVNSSLANTGDAEQLMFPAPTPNGLRDPQY